MSSKMVAAHTQCMTPNRHLYYFGLFLVRDLTWFGNQFSFGFSSIRLHFGVLYSWRGSVSSGFGLGRGLGKDLGLLCFSVSIASAFGLVRCLVRFTAGV